jgi:hypothetical protein
LRASTSEIGSDINKSPCESICARPALDAIEPVAK